MAHNTDQASTETTAAPTKTIHSRDDYQAEVFLCWTLARQVVASPIEELRAMAEHAESIGPLVEPTLFIRNGKKLGEDKRVLDALARAKTALLEAFPDLETSGLKLRDRGYLRGAAIAILNSVKTDDDEAVD
jgi:hypothetical protein